jgi:hypothetical protein
MIPTDTSRKLCSAMIHDAQRLLMGNARDSFSSVNLKCYT